LFDVHFAGQYTSSSIYYVDGIDLICLLHSSLSYYFLLQYWYMAEGVISDRHLVFNFDEQPL